MHVLLLCCLFKQALGALALALPLCIESARLLNAPSLFTRAADMAVRLCGVSSAAPAAAAIAGGASAGAGSAGAGAGAGGGSENAGRGIPVQVPMMLYEYVNG